MRRVAALLRGVNLGKRKLLSEDLAAVTRGAGYADVRTFLASGNVVFASDRASAEIERALEAALLAHGLVTDVLVRDAAELTAVIAANPFVDEAADHPSHMLVTFHRDPFPAELIAAAAGLNTGPERMIAIGRELFTDYVGRETMRESKLLQVMKKAKFPTVATARNWNTVTKLAEMVA